MMKILMNIIVCMCLLFSQMQPFYPMFAKLNSSKTGATAEVNGANETLTESTTEFSTEASTTEETANSETTEVQYSAIASNFITLDLEGYCTIDIPLSHFELYESNSTQTYKQINFNDAKTRIYMSYITGMDTTADIPGYIAREVAGVDTVTNDKETRTYGSSEWTVIKADHQDGGCNLYVYYTLNKDNTSAFWMLVKVAADSDNQEFDDIMTQMLNTYYLYAVSGTLFQTPTTGYYATVDTEDGTVADTSDYQANSDKNSVFQSRGGYVLGADIADNWDSMQIIIDSNKYVLPCSVQDFTNTGFYMNDIRINTELEGQTLVYATQTKTITYQNDNGTVVDITVYNDSASEKRDFTECQVVGIKINAEDLIDIVATSSDEVYNDETAANEMTASNAKDEYNHELILPGGITWGVYCEDLKSYYGICALGNYDPETKQFTWTSGNKMLRIRTGVVNNIKEVYMTCMNS